MSIRKLHHSKKMSPSLFLFCIILWLISGCQSIDTRSTWPSDLPDRQLFVDAHNESINAGEKVIKIEPHLVWIKRFYQGTILYPFGWNKMTELVLESLTNKNDKNNVKPRLLKLGLDISREWAKDNKVRKINSSNIAIWGGTLRTAAKQGTQLSFLAQVEQDVAAMLRGELSVKEISRTRYLPPEDFDDF